MNPWAKRTREDILDGLEAMGDDITWLKAEGGAGGGSPKANPGPGVGGPVQLHRFRTIEGWRLRSCSSAPRMGPAA
eukprot:4576901-Pyramimonas_sp.AAC.1